MAESPPAAECFDKVASEKRNSWNFKYPLTTVHLKRTFLIVTDRHCDAQGAHFIKSFNSLYFLKLCRATRERLVLCLVLYSMKWEHTSLTWEIVKNLCEPEDKIKKGKHHPYKTTGQCSVHGSRKCVGLFISFLTFKTFFFVPFFINYLILEPSTVANQWITGQIFIFRRFI